MLIKADSDNNVYEVEKLVNHKGPCCNQRYLIKWKGYSEEENSWELQKHIAKDLRDDYKQSLCQKNNGRIEGVHKGT